MFLHVSLVFVFVHIFLCDCRTVQARVLNSNLTLFNEIQDRLALCDVGILKTIWNDEDPIMRNCDIPRPPDAHLKNKYITSFQFDEYLCMALFDVSYGLCDIYIHKNDSNQISNTREAILKAKPDTFCDEMSKSLLNTSFVVDKEWIINFNTVMKNKTQCMRICVTELINPLCAFVSWLDKTLLELNGGLHKDFQQLSNVRIQSDFLSVDSGSRNSKNNQNPANSKKNKGTEKPSVSATSNKRPEGVVSLSREPGRNSVSNILQPHSPVNDWSNLQNPHGVQRPNSSDVPVTVTLQPEANNEKYIPVSTHNPDVSPGFLNKVTPRQNSAVDLDSKSGIGAEEPVQPASELRKTEPEQKLSQYQSVEQTPPSSQADTKQQQHQWIDQQQQQWKDQQQQQQEEPKKLESTLPMAGDEPVGGEVVGEGGGESIMGESPLNGAQNGEEEEDDDDDDLLLQKDTVPPNVNYEDEVKKITQAESGLVDNNIQSPHTDSQKIMQTERDSIGVYGHDNRFDAEETHFFAYFMTMIILCILGYLIFHNKQKMRLNRGFNKYTKIIYLLNSPSNFVHQLSKILALALEGRSRRGGRRRPNTSGYRKLDSNLEEAVTSGCSGTSVTQVIY